MKAERKHDKDHIPKEQKNENLSPRFEKNSSGKSLLVFGRETLNI